MTNVIIQAVKAGIEATGGAPWQVQLGMAAGGIVIGIVGSVAGWFAHKRKADNGARHDQRLRCQIGASKP